MPGQIVWTASALADFESALRFIANDNPNNARLVRERILVSVSNLDFFSLGLPAPKGHLKIYVPKTSYFVIFKRGDLGNVTVLAFIHSSRDWEIVDWDSLF